jgi:MFS family permease
MRTEPSPRSVIGFYLSSTALFTLAASIIWGVNTLFLMGAGLNIFQVMLVNATFTGGQLVFEVPTGVIADTIGRKASFLLCIATLVVATVLYVLTYQMHWGIWAFIGASVLIGLGFTFQTGAVDAWLVDALDHIGYDLPKERVFAWNGMCAAAAMIVGTTLGGVLGQIGLAWPYYVRAGVLAVTFVLVAIMMRDVGFTPRPLRLSTFGEETRKIATEGVSYGWKHPVIRPMMFVSLVSGLFFIFGFYSWQRYFLDLLGKEYIWVDGLVAAGFSLAGIIGNALVKRVMARPDGTRRNAPRLLAWISALMAVLTTAVGLVGLLTPHSATGLLPFGIAAGLYLVSGVAFGLSGPVRQGFLNENIPSAQRATVLSLDSLFADGGGVVGQVGLGWLSKAVSIPLAWVVSGFILAPGYALYRRAERADAAKRNAGRTEDGGAAARADG